MNSLGIILPDQLSKNNLVYEKLNSDDDFKVTVTTAASSATQPRTAPVVRVRALVRDG